MAAILARLEELEVEDREELKEVEEKSKAKARTAGTETGAPGEGNGRGMREIRATGFFAGDLARCRH